MEITKVSVGQFYTQFQIIHIVAEFDKFENYRQQIPGELNLLILTMTHLQQNMLYFSMYSCNCIIYCLLVLGLTITIFTFYL